GMFRVAMIERLAVGTEQPAVLERLQKLLDATVPRGERLAALRAIARGTLKPNPGLQDVLSNLAMGDPDANVEAQARAILITLGVPTDTVPSRIPPPPAPPEPA